MAVEIQPLDELMSWHRPRAGELPVWVRWAIATAAVLTVAVVTSGADVLWRIEHRFLHTSEAVTRLLPPLVMAIAIALVFAPPSRSSRFVRLAIVLPVLQGLALLVVWWFIKTHALVRLAERAPLGNTLRVVDVTVIGVAATVLVACVIARRERLQVIAMIALGNLLLLGLWVPVVVRVWTGKLDSYDRAIAALDHPLALAVTTLAPPFVLACGYAIAVTHAPRFARKLRGLVGLGVGALFAFALAFRFAGYAGNELLYDNLVHVILAAAFVAIVATVMLGIAAWRATRRAERKLDRDGDGRLGLIDDDGHDIVACLQITSWLRGPRVVTRSFVASTERGDLMVPGDARLAAALPLQSTVLRVGEAVVVLRRGDAVQIGGFVEERHGDHPFRGTTMPVPGPRGVVVRRVGESRVPAAVSIGLAAWRPAVAYLLIIAAIAIPGLAGLLTRTLY